MKCNTKDFTSYKLHIINTNKFKTTSIKVIFSAPVIKKEITIKNFLADMLTYSTKENNNEKKMSIALQDLYAMNIFSSCYRVGKLYNMEIGASILNEKYSEKGMLEKSIKLLSDVIFKPNVNNDEFDKTSFNIMFQNAKNQIASIKENTRKLSLIRMLENMGNNKEYSLHSYGYNEDLMEITPHKLYDFYKKVISSSKIDIFILGNVDEEYVTQLIKDSFKFKTFKTLKDDFIINHDKIRKLPKKVVEEAYISQSKLSIGCKLEKLNNYERNYVLPMYSLILGGGSGAKLFKEVRENNSLCYYINSSAAKLDSILYITSGINYVNFGKTVRLIKKELKNMINGEITEEELDKAKVQYITMLDEIFENPFQIISSYYSIEMFGYDDIEKRKKLTNEVSLDDVVRLSNKIHMDTIYLLKGAE